MNALTSSTAPRAVLFASAALVCATLFAPSAYAQRVDINSASVEELQELPGVGPKLADEIVRDRQKNGPFVVPEDLARVRGVSSRLVEKLMDKISVGGEGGGSLVVKEGEPISEEVVSRILASFRDEPSIREVQEAAVEYARANPDTVDGWRWRVRTNALLPELRSYVIGDIARDVRTRTSLDAEDAVVQTNDDDNSVRVAVQATWELDRIVFDRNELGVWRETMRMATLRDRVVDEVTRRYYERRRLQVDLKLTPPTELGDRVRKELRIQELTADLDALTGGWFSNELKRAGKAPY